MNIELGLKDAAAGVFVIIAGGDIRYLMSPPRGLCQYGSDLSAEVIQYFEFLIQGIVTDGIHFPFKVSAELPENPSIRF